MSSAGLSMSDPERAIRMVVHIYLDEHFFHICRFLFFVVAVEVEFDL